MKSQNNCNCCTTLSASQCFYGLGGWFLAMSVLFIALDVAVINPNNYMHIHGDKAMLARVLWFSVSTVAIVLRLTSLQKIMMLYRFKDMSLAGRFWWLLGLLILPPVLEIHCMIKLGFRQSVAVRNFWCEHHETAGINATKLAEGIKEKYFAKTEDDHSPDILISTHTGTLVSLLIRESSVYMFVLLGEGGELPMDIKIPSNSNWHVEKSSDGKSGALVCELFFAPCSAGTGNAEAELAEVIIDLLDDLPALENGVR